MALCSVDACSFLKGDTGEEKVSAERGGGGELGVVEEGEAPIGMYFMMEGGRERGRKEMGSKKAKGLLCDPLAFRKKKAIQ